MLDRPDSTCSVSATSAANEQNRHVGHFIVAVTLIGWTLFLLWREYNHLVDIRQAWLASPQHMSLARTRSIALVNVPSRHQFWCGYQGARRNGGTTYRHCRSKAEQCHWSRHRCTRRVGQRVEASDLCGLLGRSRRLKRFGRRGEDECSRLEGGVGKLSKIGNKNERIGQDSRKTR